MSAQDNRNFHRLGISVYIGIGAGKPRAKWLEYDRVGVFIFYEQDWSRIEELFYLVQLQ